MINTLKWVSEKVLETRKNAGFSSVAPIDIWKLLQNEVSIIIEPLQSDISGLFLRKKTTGVILINSAKMLGHQYFTAAHEYFHYKYDEYNSGACSAGRFDIINPLEYKADCFAACLLAPDEAIQFFLAKRFSRGLDKKLSLADVIAMNHYFGISHNAMLIRLIQSGYIRESDAESMQAGVIVKARELGYTTELFRPTYKKKIISDYLEKAMYALDSNLISSGKYGELLLEAGFGDLLFDTEEKG